MGTADHDRWLDHYDIGRLYTRPLSITLHSGKRKMKKEERKEKNDNHLFLHRHQKISDVFLNFLVLKMAWFIYSFHTNLIQKRILVYSILILWLRLANLVVLKHFCNIRPLYATGISSSVMRTHAKTSSSYMFHVYNTRP